jgi:hypothetical protein
MLLPIVVSNGFSPTINIVFGVEKEDSSLIHFS